MCTKLRPVLIYHCDGEKASASARDPGLPLSETQYQNKRRHIIFLVTAVTASDLISSSRLKLYFYEQIQARACPMFLDRLITTRK
jgi:hypothetical protein